MAVSDYRCRAIGVLVDLHDIHMNKFLAAWKIAKEKNIKLPETSDTDYESLNTLLRHIFNSSGNYLRWITAKLDLPDPGINELQPAESINLYADEICRDLLEKWDTPLRGLSEDVLDKVFKSNLGIETSIESQLEHAVMHCIRHEYQLINLISAEKRFNF